MKFELLQTTRLLALQVKDGTISEWQLALCDLALLEGNIDPDTLTLNFCMQHSEVRQ